MGVEPILWLALASCSPGVQVAPGTGTAFEPTAVETPTPAPPPEVTVAGRVLDALGKPVESAMVRSGSGEAFSGSDGRYTIAFAVTPGQPVTLVAQALDTGPCDDPGNCGISTSSDYVADTVTLEALAEKGAAGERVFQHDFRLERPRAVTVVPRVPGGGWPYLGLSCRDPQQAERVLLCATMGNARVNCKCPPGDAVIDVFRSGLSVPVPASASRVELDLRSYGGLAGRLVRDGQPVFGHVAITEDPDGPLDTRAEEGDFAFGPVPVRPVHLVYVTRDEQRIDLGVHVPGVPTAALGDFEVWD